MVNLVNRILCFDKPRVKTSGCSTLRVFVGGKGWRLSHHRKASLIEMAVRGTSFEKIDTFGKDKRYSSIVQKIETVLAARFLLFVFHLDYVKKPFLLLSDLISLIWFRSSTGYHLGSSLPGHELNWYWFYNRLIDFHLSLETGRGWRRTRGFLAWNTNAGYRPCL